MTNALLPNGPVVEVSVVPGLVCDVIMAMVEFMVRV
jgi:hypothetical protein